MRSTRSPRPRCACLVAALLALAPAGAGAQPADPQSLQVAQALYDQAVKDLAGKDHAAACPKLEEAVRLVPEGIGGRMTLAECYEGLGKLASAWTSWSLAEAAATRAGQADRQKLAHERAAALKPRLATLALLVPAAVQALPDLEIRRDGVLVGPGQWGVALPVDRGPHRFAAKAGDGRRWETMVNIEDDGRAQRVELGEPPPLPRAAPAPPALPSPPLAPAPPALPLAPPPKEAPASARRTVGLVLGGAGIAGGIVGAALGATALVKRNQSNEPGRCDAASHCDPTGSELRWASLRAGDWSTAMLVGGGVAFTAGVVLFLTAPSPSPTALTVTATPGGARVSGRF